MSAVQLAMYKAKGDLFNGLIRWWTGSQYSHCELVVRGVCYSSTIRDGGVRAKVMALLDNRMNLAYQDIKAVIVPALRHRMILNFQAEAEGITADQIIEEVRDAG